MFNKNKCSFLLWRIYVLDTYRKKCRQTGVRGTDHTNIVVPYSSMERDETMNKYKALERDFMHHIVNAVFSMDYVDKYTKRI